MKRIISGCLALSFCFSHLVLAEPLSPQARLRKISLHILGLQPSSKDYLQLQNVSASDVDKFLSQKTREYLSRPLADVKLSEKIVEALRIQVTSSLYREVDKKSPNQASRDPLRAINDRDYRFDEDENGYREESAGEAESEESDESSTTEVMDAEAQEEFAEEDFDYEMTQKAIAHALTSGLTLDQILTGTQLLNSFAVDEAIDTLSLFSKSQSPELWAQLQKSYPTLAGLAKSYAASKDDAQRRQVQLKMAQAFYAMKDDILPWLSTFREEYQEDANGFVGLYKDDGTFDKGGTAKTLFSLSSMMIRYNKTRYSRPAALFRVMLCDEMQLVALSDATKKSQQALSIFTNAPTTVASETIKSESRDEARIKDHVRGDCVNCHRKLDKAEVFFSSKLGENEKFTFVYDDWTGTERKIVINKADDLMSVIAKQPQYVRCQTERLWNWYIGEDMPLPEATHQQLISLYQSTKGDLKKMVAHLVTRPEFSNAAYLSQPPTFSTVRKTLQRCNTCHFSEGTIPSFTDLPISFDSNPSKKVSDHFNYLKEIVKLTDLNGDGSKATMPPAKANWKLTPSERLALKKWIYHGALDDRAEKTILPTQAQGLIQASSEEKEQIEKLGYANPSFRPTWKRFQSNFDIIKNLAQIVPVDREKCLNSFVANKAGMGMMDIYVGSPVLNMPGSTFVRVYKTCLDSGLKELPKSITQQGRYEFQSIKSNGIKLQNKYKSLNPQQQEALAREAVLKAYGPILTAQELKEETKDLLDFALQVQKRKPNATALDMIQVFLREALLSDEFLTY